MEFDGFGKETEECEKGWEPKAPWDGRVIQGLRLYLSRQVGNMAEYLKVSVNELVHFPPVPLTIRMVMNPSVSFLSKSIFEKP